MKMSLMQFTYYRVFTKLLVLLIGIAVFTVLMRAVNKPPSESTSLENAAKAVGWMIRPANLSRSGFTVAFPDAKPSEYVNYMFSEMGVAEWPPYEDSGEFTLQELKSMRIPYIPAGINIAQLTPDPEFGAQIVIKHDDARSMVIVEGYADPAQPPVMTEEFVLKKVPPGPGVIQIYEMNYDNGMSDRSF
ncbi:hypothetical protein ACFL6P_00325 [Candidatus Latescibacterota bacterium]